MNLPYTIEVVITPRDVLTTKCFQDIHDCAICKAIRRKLRRSGDYYLAASTEDVRIDSTDYWIEGKFTGREFRELLARAENGERFKIKKTLTRQV